MINELERIWKEVAVVYSSTVHSFAETDQEHPLKSLSYDSHCPGPNSNRQPSSKESRALPIILLSHIILPQILFNVLIIQFRICSMYAGLFCY
jgi:hypothetical protein